MGGLKSKLCCKKVLASARMPPLMIMLMMLVMLLVTLPTLSSPAWSPDHQSTLVTPQLGLAAPHPKESLSQYNPIISNIFPATSLEYHPISPSPNTVQYFPTFFLTDTT